MQQKVLKASPFIVLFIVFLTLLSISITQVSAGGGFIKKDEAWNGIDNKIAATPNKTYPYYELVDASKIKVKSVSLDILYGVNRGWGLAQYYGEVPYDQTYDGDDRVSGFGKIYARNGTSLNSTNPDGVSAKDYWGIDYNDVKTGTGSAKLSELEKVNDGQIVSLRLYALSHAINGFALFFNCLAYTIGVGFAWLGTAVLGLIVDAKNIDLGEIMNMLNLQKLNEIMNESFIYNSNSASLSPFALFAIIMFIFAVVGMAIAYAKGNDRKTGLKDLFVTTLVGLLVIGISLTGNIVTLGSTLSDVASKFIATAANVMSNTSQGYAFVTDIDDKVHTNKPTQLAEMSLIHKTYIDTQICTQFKVTEIDDLRFENLGDDNRTIAKQLFAQYVDMTGSSSSDWLSTEFNNNLGYYYWFAHSSATQKTIKNTTYPKTSAGAAEDKLNTMITYLQMVYNKNLDKGTSDALAKNEQIVKIISGFAAPNGGMGFVSLFLLALILFVLAICLFKYCLSVVIGKLELFIAILGLAIAGPLMITNKDKLVHTGKAIVGMIPIAIIEITVYGIFFDLIIYLISSLLTTNILTLIVVLVLVLLLLKLNPLIQEKIKQLLETTTRALSPHFAQARRQFKTAVRTKTSEFINNYDKKTKVVGRDKDGNEIVQERGGNALSKLMHQGYNNIFNEGSQRKGFLKINKEQTEKRTANMRRSAEAIRKDAENRVSNALNAVKSATENELKDIEKAEFVFKQDCYYKNGDETVYNENNLTDEERKLLAELQNNDANIGALTGNNSAYASLRAVKAVYDSENKKHEGEAGYVPVELDEADKKKLADLQKEIDNMKKQSTELDNKIKQSIDRRAFDEIYKNFGLDKTVQGANEEERLKKAVALKIQQGDEGKALRKELQDGITAVKDETNTKRSHKIGSATHVANKEAITSSAAMMYQLKQLDNNKVVSETSKAKEKVKDTVDRVMRVNDRHHYETDEVDKAEKTLKDVADNHNSAYKTNTGTPQSTIVAETVAAKQDVKKAKKEQKALTQEGKENKKDARDSHGRVNTATTTINDQLEQFVGNMNLDEETPKTSTSGSSSSGFKEKSQERPKPQPKEATKPTEKANENKPNPLDKPKDKPKSEKENIADKARRKEEVDKFAEQLDDDFDKVLDKEIVDKSNIEEVRNLNVNNSKAKYTNDEAREYFAKDPMNNNQEKPKLKIKPKK